jgi:hypothetical protein
MPDRLKRQRFISLAVLLLLIFIYPLISIANKPVRPGGIPLLFIYFFIAWIISIILLYRTAEKKNHPHSRNHE